MARHIKVSRRNRQAATQFVLRSIEEALQAKEVIEVTLAEPNKSRAQERHYHALIAEIARGYKPYGQQHKPEVWKAQLIDDFEQECRESGVPLKHTGHLVASLDGTRLVNVRSSSRLFTVAEAANFIEYLHKKGAEFGLRLGTYEHFYQEMQEFPQ